MAGVGCGLRTSAKEILLGVAKWVAIADAHEAIDDDEEAAPVLAGAYHLLIAAHVQLPMAQHHLHTANSRPHHHKALAAILHCGGSLRRSNSVNDGRGRSQQAHKQLHTLQPAHPTPQPTPRAATS